MLFALKKIAYKNHFFPVIYDKIRLFIDRHRLYLSRLLCETRYCW